jgi:hypothetical protein
VSCICQPRFVAQSVEFSEKVRTSSVVVTGIVAIWPLVIVAFCSGLSHSP